MKKTKKRNGAYILGRASIYLGKTYPYINKDVMRSTPERVAAELLCALKDVIVLSNWENYAG